MIKDIVDIVQPLSGEYEERIYDFNSSWNSQDWTWIKFTNDDDLEWCGEFRGKHLGHGISKKYGSVFILTSDYLYHLSIENGDVVNYEDRTDYRNLVSTPNGEYIVSSYYHLSVIRGELDNIDPLETELPLDSIVFSEWEDSKLKIYAEEFMNYDNHLILELDGESLELKIVKQSKS